MNGQDAERRLHWLRFAKEMGQEDDFRALLDDARAGSVEDDRWERWWKVARDLGQTEDFGALLNDMQRRGPL